MTLLVVLVVTVCGVGGGFGVYAGVVLALFRDPPAPRK
jgi:hypothetical protein